MGSYAGREPAKRTVGVLGSERGVGVTQFCVALANFISLESGSNVQLLDVSGTGQLARVPVTADKRLFGVTYFADVDKKQIPALMSSGISALYQKDCGRLVLPLEAADV